MSCRFAKHLYMKFHDDIMLIISHSQAQLQFYNFWCLSRNLKIPILLVEVEGLQGYDLQSPQGQNITWEKQ